MYVLRRGVANIIIYIGVQVVQKPNSNVCLPNNQYFNNQINQPFPNPYQYGSNMNEHAIRGGCGPHYHTSLVTNDIQRPTLPGMSNNLEIVLNTEKTKEGNAVTTANQVI